MIVICIPFNNALVSLAVAPITFNIKAFKPYYNRLYYIPVFSMCTWFDMCSNVPVSVFNELVSSGQS